MILALQDVIMEKQTCYKTHVMFLHACNILINVKLSIAFTYCFGIHDFKGLARVPSAILVMLICIYVMFFQLQTVV